MTHSLISLFKIFTHVYSSALQYCNKSQADCSRMAVVNTHRSPRVVIALSVLQLSLIRSSFFLRFHLSGICLI